MDGTRLVEGESVLPVEVAWRRLRRLNAARRVQHSRSSHSYLVVAPFCLMFCAASYFFAVCYCCSVGCRSAWVDLIVSTVELIGGHSMTKGRPELFGQLLIASGESHP